MQTDTMLAFQVEVGDYIRWHSDDKVLEVLEITETVDDDNNDVLVFSVSLPTFNWGEPFDKIYGPFATVKVVTNFDDEEVDTESF